MSGQVLAPDFSRPIIGMSTQYPLGDPCPSPLTVRGSERHSALGLGGTHLFSRPRILGCPLLSWDSHNASEVSVASDQAPGFSARVGRTLPGCSELNRAHGILFSHYCVALDKSPDPYEP